MGLKEPKRCQKYHTFWSIFKLLPKIVTNIFGTIFGLKMVYYGSSTSNLSISVIELLVLFAKFGQNAFLKKKILHIFTDVTLFAKIKKQTFLLQIFFCKKFAWALWLILDTSNVKFVKKRKYFPRLILLLVSAKFLRHLIVKVLASASKIRVFTTNLLCVHRNISSSSYSRYSCELTCCICKHSTIQIQTTSINKILSLESMRHIVLY